MQTSTTGKTIAPSPGTATSPQLGGVAYERVHPSTRCIIEALFPPHTRGVAFLHGLLTIATAMPYVLPDDSGEVREDIAVVSVKQGCDELRQRVHMAYDTTHMYLVIYRALGLLYEEKRGKQTLFRIPLHAYQPPSDLSERLRQLQEHYREKRPRVRRLVQKIIERIAPLTLVDAGQPPLIEPSLLHPNPLLPSTELLLRIQRGLSSMGVKDPDGHIAMCVAVEVIRADQTSQQDSSQNTSTGRFAPENLPTPQKESGGKADSHSAESTPFDVLVTASMMSDELNPPRSQQSDHAEVDSCELASTPPSTNATARAGFAAANPAAQEDAIELDSLRANVTINQYSKYITLMMTNVTLREQFQRFFATILDDDETQWRRYNPLFQELSRTIPLEPEAITAALVETLVIRHTYQSLTKPGGYFTKNCRAYCRKIPPHVHDLLKTYEHMTYEALLSSLKTDGTQRISQDLSSQRKSARPGCASAPYSFSAQGKGGRGMKQGLAEKQEPMSELEAKALEAQIKREAPFVQIQGIRRICQTAYALDVNIDGVPWAITSKREWGRYFGELRACEVYASQVTGLQGTEQIVSGRFRVQ
jgi:hypothetical protein